MISKVLKQFGRHLDILILFSTSLFAAGMAWSSVSNALTTHELRLSANEDQIEKVAQDGRTVKETVIRTEQKVDDLAAYLKHRRD